MAEANRTPLLYVLPRRLRRTGRFATAALADRPFGAGFRIVFPGVVFVATALLSGVGRFSAIGRDARCGTIPGAVGRWATHDEQRPSRSALSSLATSSDPASSLPQYVVVVKLLVRGICHSAEVPLIRLSRRTHCDTVCDSRYIARGQGSPSHAGAG